jgi:polyhydroxybutyrate depolymerase
LNTKLTTIVAVFVVTLLGAQSTSAETMTWKVDGVTRRAMVYPATVESPGFRAPLVLSFHGHGDNIENFQGTEMHVSMPDAIVVYFQGLPSARDGQPGWQTEKGQDDDRDLKLVDAALATLRSRFRVDDKRIYATGFSNGANFTYLLWAERPAVFAAFAPVAARLAASVHPATRRPLFHVAGLQDPQIRFAEQRVAFETAIKVNGVEGDGERCGEGCTLYGAKTPAPVMTWIHKGGHVYPSDTSDRIAVFFRKHHL